MPGRNLVVIGGSAGSLTPLTSVLQGLPASFSACVLIVVHSSPESAGGLAKVLSRSSHIPVTMATEGRPIERGIFVAPPNHHLIVTPGRMHVTLGPKENGFRPAVDPLFRTAAHAYESLVIGVILSGALDDGAYGMSEIKAAGGLTIVQDPGEADIDSMPRHAMRYVDLDYVVAAADIAPLLCRETAAPPHVGEVIMGETNHPDPQHPDVRTDIARMNAELGPSSGLTCPDCGGALWRLQAGNLVRYQCHVGHAYSPESLLERQDDRVEVALWTAVRALEERADLGKRMADQTATAGLAVVSSAFAEQAQVAEKHADQIRALLERSAGAHPEIEESRELRVHRRGRRQG